MEALVPGQTVLPNGFATCLVVKIFDGFSLMTPSLPGVTRETASFRLDITLQQDPPKLTLSILSVVIKNWIFDKRQYTTYPRGLASFCCIIGDWIFFKLFCCF